MRWRVKGATRKRYDTDEEEKAPEKEVKASVKADKKDVKAEKEAVDAGNATEKTEGDE